MVKRLLLTGLVGVAMMGVVGCGGGNDEGTDGNFTATTTSFTPGSAIPSKYAKKGDNISPAVSWSHLPSGTNYVAVIMDDPDAQPHAGKTWSHWAVYNIASSKSGLQEGIYCPLPDDETMGVNSYGERAYGGPKPPRNDEDHEYHTYHFVVYALKEKIEEDALWNGENDEMTNAKFATKYSSIILDKADFNGTYTRNGDNP